MYTCMGVFYNFVTSAATYRWEGHHYGRVRVHHGRRHLPRHSVRHWREWRLQDPEDEEHQSRIPWVTFVAACYEEPGWLCPYSDSLGVGRFGRFEPPCGQEIISIPVQTSPVGPSSLVYNRYESKVAGAWRCPLTPVFMLCCSDALCCMLQIHTERKATESYREEHEC